jgi:hypothetical protein
MAMQTSGRDENERQNRFPQHVVSPRKRRQGLIPNEPNGSEFDRGKLCHENIINPFNGLDSFVVRGAKPRARRCA